jgi:O-antigen/teichoic acid export membrane protein
MSRLGKTLMRNTFTNYLLLAMYLISAVFMARLLLLGLGRSGYGFWTLLWAVFGYSLLLDFGFGKTVVKYTAEYQSDGDIDRFSEIITTVVACYLVMAVLIVAAGAVLTYNMHLIFQVKDLVNEKGVLDIKYYKVCFMIFAIGVSLVFPSGVIPEILVGFKRFDLKNYVQIGNIICNLFGVWLLLHLGYSLLALTIFISLLNIFTNVVMGVFVYFLVPKLRISPRRFKLARIKEIADFSFFAYVLTMATLVIYRTDRIVLGVMSGVAAITIYQVGTRISELMKISSIQFQYNISPVTADLFKSGETDRLNALMLKSTRISAFICGCAFIVCFISAPQILKIWLKEINPDAIMIARIMLVAALFEVLFKSVAEGYILMINKHRVIAIVTVIEAVLNLSLSVTFVYMYGVVGVAWGTLIPGVLLCTFVIFPLFARYSGTSVLQYITKAYLPVLLISIPPACMLWYAWKDVSIHQVSFVSLILITGGAGALYSILGALFYFNRNERETLINTIPFVPAFVIKIIRVFPCFSMYKG